MAKDRRKNFTRPYDFCVSRFGATPLYSREDLTELDPGNRYDLIWVGSLFTYLSHARLARPSRHIPVGHRHHRGDVSRPVLGG